MPSIKSSFCDYLLSVYSHISFNFGPTLFSWIEDHYPQLAASIIQADSISAKIYGEGAAMAQAYNHRILPHCSAKDKMLQIKWGMEYFESKFKRKAKAVWLPETAVDNETLEALIACQVEFSVLSTSQADKSLIDSEENIYLEPFNYVSKNQNGKKLTLFFYNQDLSLKITQEMPNTEKYYLRILSAFKADNNPALLSIASDGENYGHHLKDGDKALSYLIKKILSDKKIVLTNYASWLKNFKAEKEIKIKENTSWSCPHGLGRWEKECGCRIDKSMKSQEWRTDLKFFTDELGEKAEKLYYATVNNLLKDPDEALFSYWQCIDKRKPDFTLNFVHSRAIKPLTPDETRKTLTALEMMKSAQLMRTSCAWFFDDISSIEPLNAIREALYLCECASKLGEDFFSVFEKIRKVKSNYPSIKIENLIEEIKAENKQPHISLCSFISGIELKYQLPFETHCNYKFKILNEKREESISFFHVSCARISTLEKREFFISVKKIEENLIFSIKESLLSDFQKNLSLKPTEFDFTCDISLLKDEDRELATIFLSKNPKNEVKKKFIISAASAYGDFDKSIEAFRIISKSENAKSIFESIPFAEDYLRHFLNLAASKPERQESKEILDFISSSAFFKTMWKYSLAMEIKYGDKKNSFKKQ